MAHQSSDKWTVRQDRLLLSLVKEHGPFDYWKVICTAFPGRSAESCRLRWLNKLMPQVLSAQADHLDKPETKNQMGGSTKALGLKGRLWEGNKVASRDLIIQREADYCFPLVSLVDDGTVEIEDSVPVLTLNVPELVKEIKDYCTKRAEEE